MHFPKPLSASVVLAALFCATAARADVTAEQVWQDWQAYYTDMGQTVSADTTERQGDTLVVTGVKMSTSAPEASYEGTIAEIRLRDVGDGTVEVTLSEEIPLTMNATPAEGEPAQMAMKFTHKGMKVIASGAPETMEYALDAPELAFALDEVKADGSTAPIKMLMTFNGSKGVTRSEKGAAGRSVSYDLNAQSLDMTVAGAEPEGGGTFNMTATMNGIGGSGSMTLPQGADMKDVNAALKAGTTINGDFAYTDGAYKIDATGPDGAFVADSTTSAGKLNFSMSQGGIAYGGESGLGTMTLSGAAMPFPIEASIGQSAFNIALPVVKSEAATPASFVMKLVDLKVSDALWNMIDPGAQLPRDPATLIVDLSGAVRPLIDLFDPKQTEAFASTVEGADAAATPPSPFEVTEAKINRLQVKAAGAELTGQGAVTFDNSAGTPKPLGAIELNLTGANKLMDTLVAMGLLPEEQIMGARMMLGLFAVPTGEDAVTSKIEFKEDGGIYANGQRLQ
jgi:Uncharacterized protein conserved in bacteria (DUF2125)